MKTKEDINHFIGFCKIIKDDFPIKILNKFSNSSTKELKLFRECLLTALKENKSCVITDAENDMLLMGNQIDVALNILDWMEK